MLIEGEENSVKHGHFFQRLHKPTDYLHFNAAGYRELGRRYGMKMLSLLGYQIDESR
jgi:hypothetical protein